MRVVGCEEGAHPCVDPIEQPKTAARLRAAGFDEAAFAAVRSNYAGIRKVLDGLGLDAVDFIFADLGCSSMQFDDPSRNWAAHTLPASTPPTFSPRSSNGAG